MRLHVIIWSRFSRFFLNSRFFLIPFIFLFVLFFSAVVFAGTVKLAWDANSESDLQGYKIYYKTGSSGAPYNGIGAEEGPSGIIVPLSAMEDPENPVFTLSGIPDGQRYYLAVTAYNDSAESGYSNEVVFDAPALLPVTHSITTASVSNGSITPAGTATVNHGASKVSTIAPDTDFHIVDVKVDGRSVGAVSTYTFSNITSDHSITATFGIDTHTITASPVSNGSITPAGTATVNHGASKVYTITPDTDFHIVDVKVDGRSVGAVSTYTFSNITSDHSITATFGIDTHTITASPVSNGSITPAGTATVNHGASKVYTITPDTDFHIVDVKVDGRSLGAVSTYTFSNITSDHSITATFGAVNQPPVANAGSNQIVPEGTAVTLDGSTSRDPDGTLAAFLWKQTAGVAVTLSGSGTVHPSFSAPQVSSAGAILIFRLTVTDNDGLTDTDTVSINVNDLVSADRDGDGVANEEDAFPDDPSEWIDSDKDGIGNNQDTDDDNDGLPDTWEIEYGLDPLNNDAGQDADGDGFSNALEYQYQTSPTEVQSIPPQNPVAMAGFDQTVTEGCSVTLDGSGSYDANGKIAAYGWVQTGGPEIVLSDETAAMPTFVPPPVSGDDVVLTFRLTVTDADGSRGTDTLDVIVQENGITGFPAGAITFYSIGDQPLAVQVHDGGHLVRLEAVDPDLATDTRDRPEILPYGLLDMDVKASSPGGSVVLTVYLPEGASEDATWYNYSDATGWQDYAANMEFNESRDQVTIVLTDGGAGDNDRQANAMILDPSGLGISSHVPAADPVVDPVVSTGDGSGGGGCFINTVHGEPSPVSGHGIWGLPMALMAALALARNFLRVHHNMAG